LINDPRIVVLKNVAGENKPKENMMRPSRCHQKITNGTWPQMKKDLHKNRSQWN